MKKYQIIYADPPWSYNDQGCQGTMANHYSGMSIQELKALPVSDIAAKNCILFMWATYPMYTEALELIKAWRFSYKTLAFQWIKLDPLSLTPFYGLGCWTRGNTEPCLLATKGKPKRISMNVFQLIQSARQNHSRKPAEARNRIVKLMGDLPRIELFARKESLLFDADCFDGWDVWGNEVESDIALFP